MAKPSIGELVSPITEADVESVTELLGLSDLDEPRRAFLRTMATLDVSACPGSGKTTLVVAKLALLAQQWTSRTQGICVLSHTNVGKEEIERRLGGTELGVRVSHYPHFIDTIHGFINRFLAIPWMLSHGYQLTAIDDDITTAVRRRHLGPDYHAVRTFLDNRRQPLQSLRIASADLSRPLGDDFPAGPHTNTHKSLTFALQQTAKDGYFRFEEMFLFADALLAEHPTVAKVLAQRFPFVLIDEMQDTSAVQNRYLLNVFPRQDSSICVQRVGDENQTIFDYGGPPDQEAFPDPDRTLSLSSSFRFDQSIADRASRFAVTALTPPGLRGTRKAEQQPQAPKHTIFIFPDDNPARVITAFGALVLTALPSQLIDGRRVAAVGEVHAPDSEVGPGHRKFPKTVAHYCDGYTLQAARRSPEPRLLVDRFRVAQSMRRRGDPLSIAVDLIAAGVIRIANASMTSPTIRSGDRPHRRLERLLIDDSETRDRYRSMLAHYVVNGKEFTRSSWAQIRTELSLTAATLASRTSIPAHAAESLEWAPPLAGTDRPSESATNAVRCSDGRGSLDVHLSSIHAVKGQTHLATLLLETFNYEHSLKSVIPWLIGDRIGGQGCNDRTTKRLRLIYVAMTRPTHLLCLALPESSLGPPATRPLIRERLADAGWNIEELP